MLMLDDVWFEVLLFLTPAEGAAWGNCCTAHAALFPSLLLDVLRAQRRRFLPWNPTPKGKTSQQWFREMSKRK